MSCMNDRTNLTSLMNFPSGTHYYILHIIAYPIYIITLIHHTEEDKNSYNTEKTSSQRKRTYREISIQEMKPHRYRVYVVYA